MSVAPDQPAFKHSKHSAVQHLFTSPTQRRLHRILSGARGRNLGCSWQLTFSMSNLWRHQPPRHGTHALAAKQAAKQAAKAFQAGASRCGGKEKAKGWRSRRDDDSSLQPKRQPRTDDPRLQQDTPFSHSHRTYRHSSAHPASSKRSTGQRQPQHPTLVVYTRGNG